MEMPFILKWIEAKNEWHILSRVTRSFVYELRDCSTMRKLFNEPEKDREHDIVINIYPLYKKCDD